MKKQIAASISILGALGWSIFIACITIMETHQDEEINYPLIAALFLVLLPAISTILYVAWTRFGKSRNVEIEKIDFEIQLLQKQIEKQELLKRLS